MNEVFIRSRIREITEGPKT